MDIKKLYEGAKEKFEANRAKVAGVVGGGLGVVGTATASFAEGTPVVTALQLAPLTDAVTANLGVLLPVGIAIMGVMLGVSLIPRIIYKFF